MRSQMKSLRVLAILGIASLVVYFFLFTWRFPLLVLHKSRFVDMAKLTDRTGLAALTLIAAMSVLFVLYIRAARAAATAGDDRRALAIVLFTALLFGLVVGAAYPVGALDVLNYIFQGRVVAHYGANPYAVLPSQYPSDPIVPYLLWPDWPSTYGPLWTLIGGAAALAYGDNLLLGIALFKAIAVTFYLATSLLVYVLLRTLRPGRAVAGALLFAWNPLVVYETVANAHNDVAMAFFAIAALYALVRGRMGLALPLLMASVLVKFITVLLLPVFLVWWLARGERPRERIVQAAWALVLAGALAVALYALFWYGPDTLKPLVRRADLFTSSPASFAVAVLKANGFKEPQEMVRDACLVLLALFALWRTGRLLKNGEEDVAAAGFDVLFAGLFLSFWFQPWYVISAAPFALATGDGARRRAWLALTAGSLLVYIVFGYVWFWIPRELGQVQLQALSMSVVFGPPFAVLLLVRYRVLAESWVRRIVQPRGQKEASQALHSG